MKNYVVCCVKPVHAFRRARRAAAGARGGGPVIMIRGSDAPLRALLCFTELGVNVSRAHVPAAGSSSCSSTRLRDLWISRRFRARLGVVVRVRGPGFPPRSSASCVVHADLGWLSDGSEMRRRLCTGAAKEGWMLLRVRVVGGARAPDRSHRAGPKTSASDSQQRLKDI